MDFGEAIKLVKDGVNVCREGWNGKGMCIYLKRGSFDRNRDRCMVDGNELKNLQRSTDNGVPIELFDEGGKGTTTRMPCICMRTVYGDIVEGWLASQTDMLAVDWNVCD